MFIVSVPPTLSGVLDNHWFGLHVSSSPGWWCPTSHQSSCYSVSCHGHFESLESGKIDMWGTYSTAVCRYPSCSAVLQSVPNIINIVHHPKPGFGDQRTVILAQRNANICGVSLAHFTSTHLSTLLYRLVQTGGWPWTTASSKYPHSACAHACANSIANISGRCEHHQSTINITYMILKCQCLVN